MASSLCSSFILREGITREGVDRFQRLGLSASSPRRSRGVITDQRLNLALGGAGLYLRGLQMTFANRTPSCERGPLHRGRICDWRSKESGSVSPRPREECYIELLKSALYQFDWSLPTFHCPILHAREKTSIVWGCKGQSRFVSERQFFPSYGLKFWMK